MKNILILIAVLLPASTQAWGDLGHQAVGEIAERNLTREGKNFIREILGPDDLANAAVWPDLVRSDPRYAQFSDYHFFEIPFGETFESMSKARRAPRSANVILSQAPERISNRSLSRDARMIFLRYFVHIVGDVHQPLHIGNGFDRGGNLCDVHWLSVETGQLDKTNLHSFVDDSIFTVIRAKFLAGKTTVGTSSKRYFGYRDLVEWILSDEAIKTLDVGPIEASEISSWYNEAVALREQFYPDAIPVKSPRDRAYCKFVNPDTRQVEAVGYDSKAIPFLDSVYIEKLLPIVKVQLFKGGHRLAYQINQIAEKYYKSEGDDSEFLKSLLLIEKD